MNLILEIIMDTSNNIYRYTQFSKCGYALWIYSITD